MGQNESGVAPPKGFRDILPTECSLRDTLLETILKTYRAYGFERIETPAIEDIRRLRHSDGGENLGLMFKILKRGEKLEAPPSGSSIDELVDLGLRYDLTVPLARYYAHNRGGLPPIFKAIQCGPVWRAERPQHGRYRQFVQCDIDIIGGASPYDEVELLSVTSDALSRLGVSGARIRLNDRRLLFAMLSVSGIPDELTGRALIALDKLDKIGLIGVKEALIADRVPVKAAEDFITLAAEFEKMNGLARLDAAKARLSTITDPRVFDDLRTIMTEVVAPGGEVVFDPFLVRGMGYYTGPVFEIVVDAFQGSIGGGGRYDSLIGKLSGTQATACGFSIGFERLVLVLSERTQKIDQFKKINQS